MGETGPEGPKKPNGTVLVCLLLQRNAKYATTMFPNIQALLKE